MDPGQLGKIVRELWAKWSRGQVCGGRPRKENRKIGKPIHECAAGPCAHLVAENERLRAALAEAESERDRWLRRMRDLESRRQHAVETLTLYDFTTPTINEIRKSRGLEPLPEP